MPARSQPPPAGTGRLLENLAGFGRALRRAGVPVDGARLALASEALSLVGVQQRADVEAALAAVLVSRADDRAVFHELFDAWFREPTLADRLLASAPAPVDAPATARRARPRVAQALAPPAASGAAPGRPPSRPASPPEIGTGASARVRLRQADFQALGADEYLQVERLARDIRLPLPHYATRRTRRGERGTRIDGPGALRLAARSGGELLRLPRRARCRQPLPLLVLLDVSGSMERYARLLLAFLHTATRTLRRRDVFAFGTRLTDLGAAMREPDSDRMLALASRSIQDFGGGTRLGEALSALRRLHARRLVGRRTLVLLVSDGLDTGDPAALAGEVDWLRRHCRRLLWLNPLLRFEGYAPLARGAVVLHARVDGMLPVHSLDTLEDMAASIARLLDR